MSLIEFGRKRRPESLKSADEVSREARILLAVESTQDSLKFGWQCPCEGVGRQWKCNDVSIQRRAARSLIMLCSTLSLNKESSVLKYPSVKQKLASLLMDVAYAMKPLLHSASIDVCRMIAESCAKLFLSISDIWAPIVQKCLISNLVLCISSADESIAVNSANSLQLAIRAQSRRSRNVLHSDQTALSAMWILLVETRMMDKAFNSMQSSTAVSSAMFRLISSFVDHCSLSSKDVNLFGKVQPWITVSKECCCNNSSPELKCSALQCAISIAGKPEFKGELTAADIFDLASAMLPVLRTPKQNLSENSPLYSAQTEALKLLTKLAEFPHFGGLLKGPSFASLPLLCVESLKPPLAGQVAQPKCLVHLAAMQALLRWPGAHQKVFFRAGFIGVVLQWISDSEKRDDREVAALGWKVLFWAITYGAEQWGKGEDSANSFKQTALFLREAAAARLPSQRQTIIFRSVFAAFRSKSLGPLLAKTQGQQPAHSQRDPWLRHTQNALQSVQNMDGVVAECAIWALGAVSNTLPCLDILLEAGIHETMARLLVSRASIWQQNSSQQSDPILDTYYGAPEVSWEGPDPLLFATLSSLTEVLKHTHKQTRSHGLSSNTISNLSQTLGALVEAAAPPGVRLTAAAARSLLFGKFGLPCRMGTSLSPALLHGPLPGPALPHTHPFADVILCTAGGKAYAAHGAVLAARAPSLLSSQKGNREEPRAPAILRLGPKVSEVGLRAILQWVYTNQAEVPPEAVEGTAAVLRGCGARVGRVEWGMAPQECDLGSALVSAVGLEFSDVLLYTGRKVEGFLGSVVAASCEFPAPHVHAHKVVLSRRCEYFEALFRSSMAESDSGTVHVPEISHEALLTFLWYLYTNKLVVQSMCQKCGKEEAMGSENSEARSSLTVLESISVAIQVSSLSEKFLMEEVKLVCESYVLSSVHHGISILSLKECLKWEQWEMVDQLIAFVAPLYLKLGEIGALDDLDESLQEAIRVAYVDHVCSQNGG